MSCSNCFNGCAEIVSDQCVKYTGVPVAVLGIQTGDSLSYVEQSLIGFLTSNCHTYIGTDPSTKTYEGLLELQKELNFYGKKVILHKTGSELFVPETNSLDLCFTSPPYFDTERYSDEETQSYKKYPDDYLWTNCFMRYTIRNCYMGLKDDGKMILNIANTPKHKNIESETIKVAQDEGFELVETLKLALSSVAGKGIKFEPIFVFSKKPKR